MPDSTFINIKNLTTVSTSSFDLHNIIACIQTHEHSDHSKATKGLLNNGIDVYSSKGTLEALGLSGHRRAKVVANKTLIRFKEFEVLVFDVNHDAAEPIGFVIREKATNQYLLFATDTSHIKQKFNVKFDIVSLECSYDADILQGKGSQS